MTDVTDSTSSASEAATPLVLALALSTRPWRLALQRHCRDHEAEVVATLVRDGRQALNTEATIVVVDDDTSWLSAPFVAQTRERNVVVVGLYDPLEADGYGLRHLQRLGVEHTVPASIPVEQLLELIREVRPDRESFDAFARVVGTHVDRVPIDRRRVLAVGGPAGAGATEIAIAVAQHWPGDRPLLIDVDETHPSLARRLGLGVHPHVITAVEAIRLEVRTPLNDDSTSLDDCLARRAVGRDRLPFDVISGLASRDDWSLVRPSDLADLVDQAAARWPVVITRIGPQLEDLSRHVDRFGLSRSIAAQADRIVGVCDATPTGILRFVDWLVDCLPVIGDTAIDVVLNRVPRSVALRAQLEQQLGEIVGERIDRLILVPRDGRIERAAWDAGLATGGPFVRAVRPFVHCLDEQTISEGVA